jgi:hypothetical protein
VQLKPIPTCPVAPLFFSETFDGDEQISALLGSFYFKGTIFPKHGKSVRAFDGENNGDAIDFFSCHH